MSRRWTRGGGRGKRFRSLARGRAARAIPPRRSSSFLVACGCVCERTRAPHVYAYTHTRARAKHGSVDRDISMREDCREVFTARFPLLSSWIISRLGCYSRSDRLQSSTFFRVLPFFPPFGDRSLVFTLCGFSAAKLEILLCFFFFASRLIESLRDRRNGE